MKVERISTIEVSPARNMFLQMWAEKMSANARLKKILREGSPAEKEWQVRRSNVEPAVCVEISKEAKRLTING